MNFILNYGTITSITSVLLLVKFFSNFIFLHTCILNMLLFSWRIKLGVTRRVWSEGKDGRERKGKEKKGGWSDI